MIHPATKKTFSPKYAPWHFILFLVFFILDGLTFYSNLIGAATALNLFLKLALIFLSLFFFLNSATGSKQKAGLIVLTIELLYLYFGPIYDNIKQMFTGDYISYTYFIPPFFVLSVIILIKEFRSIRPFKQLTFYLNIVTLSLVTYQALLLYTQASPSKSMLDNNFPIKYNDKVTDNRIGKKPDIFLVVFDAYLNTTGLKEKFNYDNTRLDNFLTQNGFYLFNNTLSDYYYTQYSMASVLNMSLINTDLIESKNNFNKAYANFLNLIQENMVLDILTEEGYSIINLSLFKLQDTPPSFEQPLQSSNQNLLLERSLYYKFRQDISIEGFIAKNKLSFLYNYFRHPIEKYNEKNLEQFRNSITPGPFPKFVYAHFLMPHDPYFYDSTGNKLNAEDYLNPEKYLGYAIYSREKIIELVNLIQTQTNGNSIIILMSDHGPHLNEEKLPNINRKNLFSIYLPNKNYSGLNDSLSISNSFRIVFNKYFNQQFPLLPPNVK